MLFYRIGGTVNDDSIPDRNEDRRAAYELTRTLAKRTEDFNNRNKGTYFFISNLDGGMIEIGAVCQAGHPAEKKIEGFCKALKTEIKILDLEEVTFNTLRNMLSCADRWDYIGDADETLEKLHLEALGNRLFGGIEYGENLADVMKKPDAEEIVDRYMLGETMGPEIERICAGRSRSGVKGHPVHYMVMCDDHDTRNDMYRALLGALLDNERIESRRYIYMDLRPDDNTPSLMLDELYKTSVGGSVIIRYKSDADTEDEYASAERNTIETISGVIKNHKNDVLTVLCMPRECTKIRELFYEYLGGMSFIELKESLAEGESARTFLKYLAKKDHIRTDRNLLAKVDSDIGYLPSELKSFYAEWFNEKLRRSVYPQYKNCQTARHKAAEKPAVGSAYDTLQDMIGLTEAKAVIEKALNYYKVQQMYKEQGISQSHPAMHMVFTGNPGTAKTTVARLFARIMKDNGLLSKGHLIEVGRSELVGRYVGWTATIVKQKFQEAKGGVLFIDEAYSLVDDRGGSFGDEAINTIVQEMENHRDELVVIFAGYPDKMEGFLNKNPGLRSRIAFHVPFADYDVEELCRIADLMGRNEKIGFTDEAKEKLHGIFEEAKNRADFGNGRYVRNLLEMARMNQAGRILRMDADKISKKDITTITVDDIEAPRIGAVKEKRQIGFCA